MTTKEEAVEKYMLKMNSVFSGRQHQEVMVLIPLIKDAFIVGWDGAKKDEKEKDKRASLCCLNKTPGHTTHEYPDPDSTERPAAAIPKEKGSPDPSKEKGCCSHG